MFTQFSFLAINLSVVKNVTVRTVNSVKVLYSENSNCILKSYTSVS